MLAFAQDFDADMNFPTKHTEPKCYLLIDCSIID